MSENMIINIISNAISEKALKKKAVAEKANLTDRQFSDILHKRRKITADEIVPICMALNLSPNELFGYGIDTTA